MADHYPFATIYEARYDAAGAQSEGSMIIDKPLRAARFAAINYTMALKAADRMRPAIKGALATDLELRDVRAVEADVVIVGTLEGSRL